MQPIDKSTFILDIFDISRRMPTENINTLKETESIAII